MRKGIIDWVNPQFERKHGLQPPAGGARAFGLLASGQTPLTTYRDMWARCSVANRGVAINRRSDGRV